GMVRASVFVIDPDRQIAEGDKLDNQAGFFYYQLDPTNPTVPSTSQQPVSPIANTSGDALCDGQGRALLTVRMTARAWSDEGPAGLKEVTVKLGERVRLAYQAFNEGGVELKALQVFRQGRTDPIVTAPTIATGASAPTGPPAEESFSPTEDGTFTLVARGSATDPRGNTVLASPDAIVVHVIRPACDAEISPLELDPKPFTADGLPISEVMQGGSVFRYYRVLKDGVPLPNGSLTLRMTGPDGTQTTIPVHTDDKGLIVHATAGAGDNPRGLRLEADALGHPDDVVKLSLEAVNGAEVTCPQKFAVRIKPRTFTREWNAGSSIETELALELGLSAKVGVGV